MPSYGRTPKKCCCYHRLVLGLDTTDETASCIDRFAVSQKSACADGRNIIGIMILTGDQHHRPSSRSSAVVHKSMVEKAAHLYFRYNRACKFQSRTAVINITITALAKKNPPTDHPRTPSRHHHVVELATIQESAIDSLRCAPMKPSLRVVGLTIKGEDRCHKSQSGKEICANELSPLYSINA